MLYATEADFEEEVGFEESVQLTNLDNPAATDINSARLERAIANASAEINSYLATRYQVPVSPVPNLLKSYCIAITRYKLAQNNAPDQLATQYNNTINRLKDIEKGQMLLVGDDGVALPQRPTTNKLIDERGQTLDDWTASYIPGGETAFTPERLRLY